MSPLSEAEARQLERQSKALESIAETLAEILSELHQANTHRLEAARQGGR